MNTSSKQYNKPLTIGLTGGIGSGKSTVAKVFAALGVPIFNSDSVAKQLLQENVQVKEAVVNAFGDVYPDGQLDRLVLAKKVFSHDEKLQQLNSIVHPAVGREFAAWVKKHKNKDFVIKEAAILIETGLYKELDRLILVTCPEDVRVKRVMKRDGITEEEVNARMKNQWSDEDKKVHANFEIDTHNEMVVPQVLDIYGQIKSLTM